MKLLQTIAIAFLIITGLQCKKNSNGTDVPGLPPATQSGANTFGFLLNGVPWTPAGNNGSGNNLSIDYDPSFNNGSFGIHAYNVLNNQNDFFYIGTWNINNKSAPFNVDLSNNSNSFCGFYTSINCWLNSNDTLVKAKGSFFIDALDKQKRIIAGRFEFSLEKSGCPIINITKGRFDFKF
ncbi:MAG: hypothetical protein EAY72_00335 [Bacteroidetes bacterium]|nr:MAG: hypothetical protein EAY72_00335 [Bacteroidota bacterium]TAE61819.1 MAG: hypothetical protein EAY68_09660 [Bacteroidota bacterium]